MDQSTFETFVRRASDLLDRRSLLGGLSAALLPIAGLPLAAEAKKPGKKKQANQCCDNSGQCDQGSSALFG